LELSNYYRHEKMTSNENHSYFSIMTQDAYPNGSWSSSLQRFSFNVEKKQVDFESLTSASDDPMTAIAVSTSTVNVSGAASIPFVAQVVRRGLDRVSAAQNPQTDAYLWKLTPELGKINPCAQGFGC
jgi:hypothetical protein